MTNQEIFDTVLAFIRKQGKPSGDEDQCYYQHPDNPAIGCAMRPLIDMIEDPDAREEALREVSVEVLVEEQDLSGSPLAYADLGFLAELQSAHDLAATNDDSLFRERFEENMREAAEKYNLHYAEQSGLRCIALAERVVEAARDVASSAVVFDDDRIAWVEAQVNREALTELRAALAALEDNDA